MGLFDFLKKKEEKTEETEKGPWELAYQARPQAYRTPEGGQMISFVLTEGTDTILPMDPRRMCRADGKEIDDFRLAFCSLQEDGIIASLPYYACIPALADHVMDAREPFVLVGAMSSEEMKELCAKVTGDIEMRGHLQKAFEANLEFIGLDHTSCETVSRVFAGPGIKIHTFENVRFSSGNIIVGDPFISLSDEENITCLDECVTPGCYPLDIAVVHPPHDGVRIAGLRMRITDREAVTYRPAETWYARNGIRHEGLMGFAVEAGLACITDEAAAQAYRTFTRQWQDQHPGENLYDSYFAALFQESYESFPELQREHGDFIRWQIPESEEEIVICASGYGDGYYSTFCGYDEEDRAACIAVMFIDPQLFEEE